MDAKIKMLIAGAPVRLILEGAFSEIHAELTEELEALLSKVERLGDFQVGNSLNPNYTSVKTDFDKLLNHLDQYHLNSKQLVDQTIKVNPNVTYVEILKLIQEKLL